MTNTFFVDYKLYNGTNEGWAYKTELKTTDLSEAERKFGELIRTYYGLEPFTFGCILLTDMFGNAIEKKYWEIKVEETIPEENVDEEIPTDDIVEESTPEEV